MASYFMPSEVARLILGYLINRGLQKTLTTFLQECPDLKEFYQIMKTGIMPPTTILGQSLMDILSEFAELKLKAARSSQLPIQPTVRPECNSAESSAVIQVREQAEEAIIRQRLAWRVSKERERAKHKKAREVKRTATVSGGDQFITSTVASNSSCASNPECLPVSVSSHMINPENICIAVDNTPATNVADVEETPNVLVEGEQVGVDCVMLPKSSGADSGLSSELKSSKAGSVLSSEPTGAKLGMETRQETGAKLTVQDSTRQRMAGEENVDYLDWLLEETHFHEKLAENINKALLECDDGYIVDNAVEQAGPSLERSQVKKFSEVQKQKKDPKKMVNRGFNLNQIIEMTESDPSFQNFLQLFQQGTTIPLTQFDVPVVNLSNELINQPCSVSVSSSKQTTSQGSSKEQVKSQDTMSALPPVCSSEPQSTDRAHADISHTSLLDPFTHHDTQDSQYFLNNCSFGVSDISLRQQHDMHDGHQNNLSNLTSFSGTLEFTPEVKSQVTECGVSSSLQLRPFTCSTSSQKDYIQNHLGNPQIVDNCVVTNTHLSTRSCTQIQGPSVMLACPPEKEAHQVSITPDENSLTAFSLIRKNVAEMIGEQYLHQSGRNAFLSHSESHLPESERDNNNPDNISLASSHTATTHTSPQDIHRSSLLSVNDTHVCGNKTSLDAKTKISISPLVSNDTVCVGAGGLVGSCEDACSKKNYVCNTEGSSELQENKISTVTSSSVSSTLSVPSILRESTFSSRAEMTKFVVSSGCDPPPDSFDRIIYPGTVQVNPVCLSDCLPSPSSQTKLNDIGSIVSKQCEDSFHLGSLLQKTDRPVHNNQNLMDSGGHNSVSDAAVASIEKGENEQENRILFHPESNEQLVRNTRVTFMKHPVAKVRQNERCTENSQSGSLASIRETKDNHRKGTSNSSIQSTKKPVNHETDLICLGKETLLSGHDGANCDFDVALREAVFSQGQKDNSARNESDKEQCSSNHGGSRRSQRKEKVDRSFLVNSRRKSNIATHHQAKRSQSLCDVSAFSTFQGGQYEQTNVDKKNIVSGLVCEHRSLGSPPYDSVRFTNSNSPNKFYSSIHPLTTCSSLPASFGGVGHHNSKLPNRSHKSPFKQTQPRTLTNGSQLHEENQQLPKMVGRKVIAVHSEHAPFIPDHCKKNPSRRIIPKEVAYSTPSPLQDFPSSPMNYVIDLPLSQPDSPFSPKESISKQLSVGKFLLSPDGHITRTSQRALRASSCHERASSCHENSNSQSRAEQQPCEEQQKEKAPVQCISQLEQLGIKLPPSPSRRKPRRVKLTQLSSAVNGGWSSPGSSFVTQDRSSSVTDDAKIVSSTSDCITSAEAEAFIMLKKFLATSYSKPQPRQQITSTDQKPAVGKCDCLVKQTCKHRKGRGGQNLLSNENPHLGKDQHKVNDKDNVDVQVPSQCDSKLNDECIAESVVVSATKIVTNESKSMMKQPAGNLGHSNLLVKNHQNKDLSPDSSVHLSESQNSLDTDKSFAVIGMMEYGPKVSVGNEKFGVAAQLPVCKIQQSVPLVNMTKGQVDAGMKHDPFVSEKMCDHSCSNQGISKLPKTTYKGTLKDIEPIFENLRQKAVVEDICNTVPKKSQNKSTEFTTVWSVQSKDSLPSDMTKGAVDAANDFFEVQKSAPSTSLSSVMLSSSCQDEMNSFSCVPISERPLAEVDMAATKLVTQETDMAAVSKQENFTCSLLQSCQEQEPQQSHSYPRCEYTDLNYMSNQLLNGAERSGEVVKSSHSSVVEGKTMLAELTTPDGVHLIDDSSAFCTENISIPCFPVLTSNVGTSSASACVGTYSSLLQAPLTSSDMSLTGLLCSSLRLAHNIEQPFEVDANSISSPMKHCSSSWGEQDAEGLSKDYCKSKIYTGEMRPGSPSLLSKVMADCGIPFEGSNLTMPQALNNQDHIAWQNESVHQAPTISASINTVVNNTTPKMGRKSRSTAQKPSYTKVAHILPSLGVQNLVMTKKNAAEVNHSSNNVKILPKPSYTEQTPQGKGTTVQDNSTLLGQIQVISSANGPVIIIPPGLGGVVQQLLSEGGGASSQINFPHKSNENNLPIDNQLKPNDVNMKVSHGCDFEMPYSSSCQESLLSSEKMPLALSQTETLKCQSSIETADSMVGKESEDDIASKNILRNVITESMCDMRTGTEDLRILKGKARKDKELKPDNSRQEVVEQLSKTSKSNCVKKIEVQRSVCDRGKAKKNKEHKPENSPQEVVEQLSKTSKRNRVHKIGVQRSSLDRVRTADLHLLNRRTKKTEELESDNSPQEDVQQFSKTRCVRKIAVRRKIYFNHVRTSNKGDIKTDRKNVPERDAKGRFISSAKSKYCGNDTSRTSNKEKCPDVCPQPSGNKLDEQNTECAVQENKTCAGQIDAIDEKGDIINEKEQHKVSNSDPKINKQQDLKALFSVQKSVFKIKQAVVNKVINSGQSLSKSPIKTAVDGDPSSGLFKRTVKSSSKRRRKVQKTGDLCESISEQSTKVPLQNKSKQMQTKLTSPLKFRSDNSPQKMQEINKRLSTVVCESDKSRKDYTVQLNDPHIKNTIGNSVPIINKEIKLKRADQEYQIDSLKPAKKRRLDKFGDVDFTGEQQMFTSKKCVHIIEDCRSGEAIELGTVLNNSSDKPAVAKLGSDNRQHQKMEDKSVSESVSKKARKDSICKEEGFFTCSEKPQSSIVTLKINTDKSQSLNVTETNTDKSQKFDRACQYIRSMPVQSLQSIFDTSFSPRNVHADKTSPNIGNKVQDKSENPKLERDSVRHKSTIDRVQDHPTTRRRKRKGTVPLNKVVQAQKLLVTQSEVNTQNGGTQNSETVTSSDFDCVSKTYDNETESAVASLELCMNGDHCKVEEPSVNKVSVPLVNSLCEDVLQLPAASSPSKESCFDKLVASSPKKLHLPPKKRLSSDFIVNGKGVLQDDSISTFISENVPTEDKRAIGSSHVSFMLPSQLPQHVSKSETPGVCSQSVVAFITSLTQDNTQLTAGLKPSDHHSSQRTGSDLPWSQTTNSLSMNISEPLIRKKLHSALESEVSPVPPSNKSLNDFSTINPVLHEQLLPGYSSLKVQHKPTLNASPSATSSVTQDSCMSRHDILAKDGLSLGFTSTHAFTADTESATTSPNPIHKAPVSTQFTESKVNKLLKKLHKKKKIV